jgi:hypothetical protein
MLTKTFIHIQGIGLKTESELWQAGALDWTDFRRVSPDFISPARSAAILEIIAESRLHLTARPEYFTDRLPASQHWRIFPHFRQTTAFLDIETTGLGDYCDITTIALYDGRTIRYYIQGENLADFPAAIQGYDVLVSYNGKSFDIPVIERFFHIKLNQAHIDLRYVLNGLGIKGGLKGCEQQLGLNRGELAGVNGYTAVLLWNLYRETGERRALETLLAYNIMDTVNLELLMVEAYNRSLAATPFRQDLALPMPGSPPIPFGADQAILAGLNRISWESPWRRQACANEERPVRWNQAER